MYGDGYASFGMELLGHGNYIAVNRTLIRRLGLNAAVMIGELADKARMFESQGKLKDGWFYVKVNDMSENTGLGERAQRTAIDDLVRLGIIEVEYMGLPKKRWFRIDFHRIMDVVAGIDLEPRAQEPEPEPEPEEPATLFDTDDYFEPPTREVSKRKSKAEMAEDAQEAKVTEVLDHLNEVTGSSYSTMRNDNRMNIRARLREGYTVEQCKAVIDKKARKWLGTQFADNLNPSTLFDKRKSDIYLQQPDANKTRRRSEDDEAWDGGW